MRSATGYGNLSEERLVALYRLARRTAAGIVPSRDAEDVAAEAIERLLRHERRLRGHPSLEGWVVLTARRRALDVGRSAASRTLLGAEGVEGTGGAVGFEDDTVARLGIEQAVAALPARQAEAVRLRYLDGLSEADVATRMGLSVGAVKSHLRRGRLALERSWPAPGGAAIGPWDIPPGEDGALAP